MTVTEGEGRRGEGGVLGQDVLHPMVQAQVHGPTVEGGIEFLDDVLALLPPGVDGGDRSIDTQRAQGRRSGHLEALGSEQDGAHGFVGWSVGVSGRGP